MTDNQHEAKLAALANGLKEADTLNGQAPRSDISAKFDSQCALDALEAAGFKVTIPDA